VSKSIPGELSFFVLFCNLFVFQKIDAHTYACMHTHILNTHTHMPFAPLIPSQHGSVRRFD
jgi:hypothetical protein